MKLISFLSDRRNESGAGLNNFFDQQGGRLDVWQALVRKLFHIIGRRSKGQPAFTLWDRMARNLRITLRFFIGYWILNRGPISIGLFCVLSCRAFSYRH